MEDEEGCILFVSEKEEYKSAAPCLAGVDRARRAEIPHWIAGQGWMEGWRDGGMQRQ